MLVAPMNGSPRQRLFDRFAPIVIGLIVLPAVGVTGYWWIEGWSFLDALFMTVITLSTVGYSEIHPLSSVGRIFTMGLIVSGGVLAAFSLTQLAHILFSGEWRGHWESQKRLRMLARLSNHIIVCGYGRVILPYHITGRRLVTMLVRPDVADFLDEVSHASGMELLLEQVQVAVGSSLAGQTLADAQARYEFDVTVLACKTSDGKWNCRPRGVTVMEPQTQLIALGTHGSLQKLIVLARG